MGTNGYYTTMQSIRAIMDKLGIQVGHMKDEDVLASAVLMSLLNMDTPRTSAGGCSIDPAALTSQPTETESHKLKHIRMHDAFGELLSDWLDCEPGKNIGNCSILELVNWSAKQAHDPDHSHCQ